MCTFLFADNCSISIFFTFVRCRQFSTRGLRPCITTYFGFSHSVDEIVLVVTTDTQRELFFKNLELLGLGRYFGLKFFEAFGVFSTGLSAPILVLWVPCPCFPLFNHYFYKKLSLYIQLPNIYLGVGFEFGPQRIWDLALVCPWSVVVAIEKLHNGV